MSEAAGWVKIHRKMWENPVITKDHARVAVWIWLLTHATHKPYDTLLAGKRIRLRPGQLITGRRKLAQELHLNEHRVERILNEFKIEQQIEQLSTPRGSLITIKNWHKYQDSEQPSEQLSSNCRATGEQLASTKQELEELEEVVVDARARTRGTAAALSDLLSDEEWKRLDRQFDDFLDLIDRIDDQVTDPAAIEKPYAYYLQAANNLNWPRKEGRQ